MKTISLPGDKKAIVDDDFPYLDRRFHIDSLGYPRAYIDGKRTRLHTIIMGVRKGYDVDHINRNKLDNQSSNLRHVTHAENLRNRRGWGKSGLKNIQYKPQDSGRKPYSVAIKRDGKSHRLGSFSTVEDAQEAIRIFNAANS